MKPYSREEIGRLYETAEEDSEDVSIDEGRFTASIRKYQGELRADLLFIAARTTRNRSDMRLPFIRALDPEVEDLLYAENERTRQNTAWTLRYIARSEIKRVREYTECMFALQADPNPRTRRAAVKCLSELIDEYKGRTLLDLQNLLLNVSEHQGINFTITPESTSDERVEAQYIIEKAEGDVIAGEMVDQNLSATDSVVKSQEVSVDQNEGSRTCPDCSTALPGVSHSYCPSCGTQIDN